MTILDTEIIKKLSGDPNELNLTDDVKEQAGKSGESDVELFTGKDSWLEDDKYFGSAVHAGYLFAVAFIRSNGDKQEAKQKQEFEQAIALCTQIHDRLDKLGLLESSSNQITGIGLMQSPNDPRGGAIILNDSSNAMGYGSWPTTDDVIAEFP